MVRMEELKKGMRVYSADGHRLGKVLAVGSSHFQVARGLPFARREYLVRLSDVEAVDGGQVRLRHDREHMRGPGGGFMDKGYADRGLAGDTQVAPTAGVGAGLAPAAEHRPPGSHAASAEEVAAGQGTVPGVRNPDRGASLAPALGPTRGEPMPERAPAPTGSAAQVGMTGDVAHPDLGAPPVPSLGPTRPDIPNPRARPAISSGEDERERLDDADRYIPIV